MLDIEPNYRITLFGQVAAWQGDRPVPLGSARQRAVFALLACAAGQPVTYDALVDALWGLQPPRVAANVLQTYIKHLRNAFEPDRRRRTPSGLLPKVGDGYALLVDPGQVDVHRFRALVDGARKARRAGNHPAVVRQLDEALRMWSPPMLDVPTLTDHPWTIALHQEHRTAATWYAEASLATGGAADAVRVVEAAAATHPLDEPLQARLMRLYHASDRRAEALAAYQRTRRMLADELGVDPGPDLREAHDVVLRDQGQDPEPDAAPAPAQLPRATTPFVGRDEELARLDEYAATPGIVALVGPAGIGKSTLAVAWGHRVADRFPDGQLFVDLRGFAPGPPLGPADALAGFLRALGVPGERIPHELTDRVALFRTLAAGRRLLVVLDNAAGADQVEPLLPAGAATTVVVTSRTELRGLVAGYGAHRRPVGPLSANASVTLLAAVLRARWSAEERAEAAVLADLCGRLPLALRIVAANLAGADGLQQYAARLRADRLDGLSLDGSDHLAVRTAFDRSYAALPDAAQRMFRLLGAAPGGDIAAAAAAALAGHAERSAARTLRVLSDAHLVEESAAGRYRMHDLIKTYAIERGAGHDRCELDDALGRLRDFYLHTARAATDLAYPSTAAPIPPPASSVRPLAFDGSAGASAWLDQERAALVAAIRQASRVEPPLPWTWTCAEHLMRYFWCSRHNTEWLATGEAGLNAAHQVGDLPGQAAMLNYLGVAYWARGEFHTAIEHIQRALTANARTGECDRQAANLSNLCGLYRAVGRIEEATRCGEQAVHLYAQIGNTTAEANALCNLSMLDIDRGQLRPALTRLHRARQIYHSRPYTDGQATVLLLTSDIHRDLGQLDDAADELRKVLKLTHHDLGQVNTIYARAGLLTLVDPPTGATSAGIIEVLADAHALGDAQVELEVLCAAGDIAHRSGQHRRAVEHYAAAVDLARRSGETNLLVSALCGLAAARHAIEPAPERLDETSEAVNTAVRAGLVLREGKARTIDAEIALALGRIDHARQAATIALRIHTRCGTVGWQRRAQAVLDRLGQRHTRGSPVSTSFQSPVS